MTENHKGIYTAPFKQITEENIEEYAKWCDGIVVNDTIVFKDKLGVLRPVKIGGVIIKSERTGEYFGE